MKLLSIAIEGIDGSGKTTQAIELVDRLNHRKGRRSFYAKSPKGSSLGERFRELVDMPGVSPRLEMLAFLFSNAIFYQEIVVPRIIDEEIVVFDRWIGSFMNYFNLLLGFDYELLNESNTYFMGDFSVDRTFLLDVSAEKAMERIRQKKNLSKYDNKGMEFLEDMRNGFLRLAEKYNWIVVDGSKSISTVHEEINLLVSPLL